MNPRILHHKVARASIISESEVSITVLCMPSSPYYTAVQIKNRYKKYACNQSSYYTEVRWYRTPVIIWNWSIHYPVLSAIFNSLHCSTNQELF